MNISLIVQPWCSKTAWTMMQHYSPQHLVAKVVSKYGRIWTPFILVKKLHYDATLCQDDRNFFLVFLSRFLKRNKIEASITPFRMFLMNTRPSSFPFRAWWYGTKSQTKMLRQNCVFCQHWTACQLCFGFSFWFWFAVTFYSNALHCEGSPLSCKSCFFTKLEWQLFFVE